MTAPIPGIEPLDWSTTRQVLYRYAIDWYDGPRAGVFLLSNPEEEIGIDAIAMLYNPEGIDFMLAKAWPVPPGTIGSLDADPLSAVAKAFFQETQPRRELVTFYPEGMREHSECVSGHIHPLDGAFGGSSQLFMPATPELLIAFSDFPTILGAWRLRDGAFPSREQMGQLLRSVAR